MSASSAQAAVVVVDHDVVIQGQVERVLHETGHRTFPVADPAAALRAVFDVRPGLIVLDLASGPRGWQVLARLRECCETPILAMTSPGRELDLVRALASGADDVVTKPFRPAEFGARCGALLRRTRTEVHERYDDGFLTIDYERHAVTVAGTAVRLTPLEFRLLSTLVRHSGQVLSRSQLLELVWGHHGVSSGDEVRVYIRYLRRKLLAVWPDDAIETVRGFGYAYAPPARHLALAGTA